VPDLDLGALAKDRVGSWSCTKLCPACCARRNRSTFHIVWLAELPMVQLTLIIHRVASKSSIRVLHEMLYCIVQPRHLAVSG